MNRPEYLKDSDVISSRFQVNNSDPLLSLFSFDAYMFSVGCNFAWLHSKLDTEKRCIWCVGAIPWFGAH
jgi:hypothetical protein